MIQRVVLLLISIAAVLAVAAGESFASLSLAVALAALAYVYSKSQKLRSEVLDLRTILSLPSSDADGAASETLESLRFRLAEKAFSEERASKGENEFLSSEELAATLSRFSSVAKVLLVEETSQGVYETLFSDLNSKLELQCLELIRSGFAPAVGSVQDHASELSMTAFRNASLNSSFRLAASAEANAPVMTLWLFFESRAPSPSELSFIEARWRQFIAKRRVSIDLERSRREVSEVKDESTRKSKYLAQLSHDVRSPLFNIRSVFEFLEDEVDDSRNEELNLIRTGQRNVRLMADIVNGILDITRLREGALEAKKKRFDLSDTVSEMADTFSLSAKQKNLKLEVHKELEGVQVEADPVQLRRAISNLISNSVKYTSEGFVRLSLERGEGQEVYLAVEDSGVGMDESELKDLFQPFSRFKREMSSGIGLGMPITLGLLELNGVGLKVSSESGVGTKVLLGPFTNLGGGGSKKSPSKDEESSQRILVVDDDKDYLLSFQRAMAARGIQVSCADSVEAALEEVAAFDVLISDGTLGDGDCCSLIRAARGLNPDLRSLVVSGGVSEDTELQLAELGVERIFQKPVSVDEVISYLEAVAKAA